MAFGGALGCSSQAGRLEGTLPSETWLWSHLDGHWGFGALPWSQGGAAPFLPAGGWGVFGAEWGSRVPSQCAARCFAATWVILD